MKHLFKATKLGGQKKRKEFGSILMTIQKRRLSKSSKNIKELLREVIHIQGTNMTDRNIMM